MSLPLIESRSHDAFNIVGGRMDAGVILVCDHASNAVPADYRNLGLDEAQFARHIAYDIGAEAVTRQLACHLGAPAVMSRFSRLLIDPNRGEDDPTLIMRLSDGAIIPGNRVLTADERVRRLERFHRPYHGAIDDVIDRFLAGGVRPALVSIHSFTESWKGVPRPWQIGVLWDADPRLPQALLDAFCAYDDLTVGDNVPYTGKLPGDTMWTHGTQRGLAHAIIEIRQDLIATAEGQGAWAGRIALVMEKILDDPRTVASFAADV